MLDSYLARLFCQDCAFFLLGPANNHFHAEDVQRDPVIPLSTLPSPLVSSPCLNANEGIDLQAIGSSDCLTLELGQTDQIWKGEPSELLVAKGYWKAVGAKLLRFVDETFCSVPTDGAKCCYLDQLIFGASAMRYKPTKRVVQ